MPADDEKLESGDAVHHWRFRSFRAVTVRRSGSAHRARNPMDQVLGPNFEGQESATSVATVK